MMFQAGRVVAVFLKLFSGRGVWAVGAPEVRSNSGLGAGSLGSYGSRLKFVGVRARILAWYILLITLTGIVSIVATRELLFLQLYERLESSLTRETEQFKLIVRQQSDTAEARRPTEIFDAFFQRHIPHDNECMLAFIDGQLYRERPSPLPPEMVENGPLVNFWRFHSLGLTERLRGERASITGERFLFVAEPLVLGGQTRGALVAAHCISCERRNVEASVLVVTEVFTAVMLIASALAWIAAGRVLAPLRLLTETAHHISESDLTRRIPVEGKGEIAELTVTFNEMLDRLEAAFASQRQFINDAGHELRTPITIIRGHLELLGDDPEERRETLALVTDELDRMSRFVEDLLLLAKAEQPRFLSLQTIDLADFTEELFAKAKALAPRNWQLDTIAVGYLVADRQRLTQAVMNLAQNAAQYCDASATIRLGSARDRHTARFWVADNGPGIDESEQADIFKRFHRASQGRRRSDGAGLGLAIVRAIAEAHGGQVHLESRPGEGSTFTVVIPLDPPGEQRPHEPLSRLRALVPAVRR